MTFKGEFDGSYPYDHDGFHSKTNLMVMTHLTMMDFTRRRIWWFWPIWPWWIPLEDEFDGSDLSKHDKCHSKMNLMVVTHMTMMDFTRSRIDGSYLYKHFGFHLNTNLMVLTHIFIFIWSLKTQEWSFTFSTLRKIFFKNKQSNISETIKIKVE